VREEDNQRQKEYLATVQHLLKDGKVMGWRGVVRLKVDSRPQFKSFTGKSVQARFKV